MTGGTARPREDERLVRLGTSIAFRAALVVLLVFLAAWWLYLVREVLVVAFLALIIAAAIHAPVAALERRGLRRVLAVLIVYLLLFAAVGLLLALLIPPLVAQAGEFAEDLPNIVNRLSSDANALLAQFGLSSDANVIGSVLGQLGNVGGLLARIPAVVVGFLSALLLVTFLSALMVLERDRARTWSMRFVAPHDRPA